MKQSRDATARTLFFVLFFIIVLTVKTVFKVVAGGITVASTLEVLSRGSTFDQLVSAVNKCVLPAGTSLIQITEGCICLTVQAENLSSLQTLWSLYKDGTLKARLQDFFVTEEVRKELAGGDELEVTVTIEEGEYQKAHHELSCQIEGSLLGQDHPDFIFTTKISKTFFPNRPHGQLPLFVHSSDLGFLFSIYLRVWNLQTA